MVMKMMSTSCIVCTDAVENPVGVRVLRQRRWTESDAKFLRMIAQNGDLATGDGEPVDAVCYEGYSSRQRYLQTYTFSVSHKERVARRTKKWWRMVKRLKGSTSSAAEARSVINSNSGFGAAGGRSSSSSSFLDAICSFLFLCVAKVDVDDVVLRPLPGKFPGKAPSRP